MRLSPAPRFCKLFGSVILALGIISPSAFALQNKLDIQTGYYSLTGTASGRTGSKSGPGAYRIGYRRNVLPKLDLGVGYSVIYSSIFTGDSTFGLDVSATYFPFSASSKMDFEAGRQTLSLNELWRPYLSLAFNQRNIQSIQTSYAGFSVAAGTERAWKENTSFNFTLRYANLSGPRSATATIIEVLGGLCFGF